MKFMWYVWKVRKKCASHIMESLMNQLLSGLHTAFSWQWRWKHTANAATRSCHALNGPLRHKCTFYNCTSARGSSRSLTADQLRIWRIILAVIYLNLNATVFNCAVAWSDSWILSALHAVPLISTHPSAQSVAGTSSQSLFTGRRTGALKRDKSRKWWEMLIYTLALQLIVFSSCCLTLELTFTAQTQDGFSPKFIRIRSTIMNKPYLIILFSFYQILLSPQLCFYWAFSNFTFMS